MLKRQLKILPTPKGDVKIVENMVAHAREHELLQGYTSPPRIKANKVDKKKQKEKKFRGGGGGRHMHEHDRIANYANDGNLNCFKCGPIGHFSSD